MVGVRKEGKNGNGKQKHLGSVGSVAAVESALDTMPPKPTVKAKIAIPEGYELTVENVGRLEKESGAAAASSGSGVGGGSVARTASTESLSRGKNGDDKAGADGAVQEA